MQALTCIVLACLCAQQASELGLLLAQVVYIMPQHCKAACS